MQPVQFIRRGGWIVVVDLEVVKKPLFIGASHVIIIPQKIFATLLQRFISKSFLQQLQLFPLASKLKTIYNIKKRSFCIVCRGFFLCLFIRIKHKKSSELKFNLQNRGFVFYNEYFANWSPPNTLEKSTEYVPQVHYLININTQWSFSGVIMKNLRV